MPHDLVSSIMSRASCHFSTCPTSAGMPHVARRATLPGSALGEAGSQLSGRNRRQSTAADALSDARCRDTPAWQLVTLPAVPVYSRATHAEASPSLRKPVSSTVSAAGLITCCIRQAKRARTCAASHGLVVTKFARACRLPSSPRRAAIGSTDLRHPVQQQAPQVDRSPPALIRPRERLEHLRREVLRIARARRDDQRREVRVQHSVPLLLSPNVSTQPGDWQGHRPCPWSRTGTGRGP